ncbi:MAG: hypothetical protein LBV58_00790 [Acholeplasmatales bacterium]|jgi:multisubunit Na+/H+ antiporter MnhG subunit|nr:hypothetical protein [Acholeplasmatales bacterium]
MKFNVKLFNSVTVEPIEVQNINGNVIEIYYLDDSPFFELYSSKANFVIWSSNGSIYRLFIERTFYAVQSKNYSPEINEIWVDVYSKMSAISKKVTTISTIVFAGVCALALFLGLTFLKEYMIWLLIGVLLTLMVSSSVQQNYLRKKVGVARIDAYNRLKSILGEDGYKEMVDQTEEHYKEFFHITDETLEVDQDENGKTEVIENVEVLEISSEEEVKVPENIETTPSTVVATEEEVVSNDTPPVQEEVKKVVKRTPKPKKEVTEEDSSKNE